MRCRLCLIECTEQSASSVFVNDGDINFCELIMQYLSFEIKSNDTYSTVICQNCSRQLTDFDNFCIYIKRCQYALKAVARKQTETPKTKVQTKDRPAFECLLFRQNDEEKHKSNETNSEDGTNYSDEIVENDLVEDNEDYYQEYDEDNEEHQQEINEQHGCYELEENIENDLTEEMDEDDFQFEENKNIVHHDEDSTEVFEYMTENDKTPKDPEIARILDFDELDDRTCVVCHKVLKNYFVLKGHMYRSHKDRIPFSCKLCKEKFRSKRALRHHFIKIHKFQLPRAKIVMLNKMKEERLKKLKENQNLENDDHNYCNANDAKQKDDDVENRTCPVCHKMLKNFMVLKSHMILVHKNIKLFSCVFCGQKFRLNRYLKYHLKVDKKCSKLAAIDAPVKHVLKQHEAAHPLADLPILNRTCAICEREFKSVLTLKSHMHTTHHGIKPYGCTFCGASFALRPSLQRHLLKDQKCSVIKSNSKEESTNLVGVNENDAENRKCAVCETTLSSIILLRAHMFKKHKDIKPFTCNICGQKFRLRLSLQRHLFRDAKCSPGDSEIKPQKKPIDEGPLEERTCGVCSQICKNPHALKTHMCFRHKGIKPFSCDYCELNFAMKRSLTRHTRRVHYDLIPVHELINQCVVKKEDNEEEMEVSWSFELQDDELEEEEIAIEADSADDDYTNLDVDTLIF